MYALGASRARGVAKSRQPPATTGRYELSRRAHPSEPPRRRDGRLARVVPTASDGRAEDLWRAAENLVNAASHPSGRCAAGALSESVLETLFDLRDDAFSARVRGRFSADSRGPNCCAQPHRCPDSACQVTARCASLRARTGVLFACVPTPPQFLTTRGMLPPEGRHCCSRGRLSYSHSG